MPIKQAVQITFNDSFTSESIFEWRSPSILTWLYYNISTIYFFIYELRYLAFCSVLLLSDLLSNSTINYSLSFYVSIRFL